NLEWTTVAAPISGRVSQRLVTPGNLIIADQTLLTTIVSLDPIYVYFTVDERTLLRLRAKYADTTGSRDPAFASLEMGLADEKGYSHKGTLNFEDNTVDQSTGTMLMRGVFANPITPAGARLLSPGLFARVRLNIGKPRPGILVADRAIGNDQGKKFVYVIADKADEKTGELKKVVERRYIQIGDLHQGLREIKTATKTGKLPTRQTVGASEEIVVAGLQRLRPGSQVTPKLVDMPVAEEKAKKTGIRKSNPSSH
ncbi:MAG TPA: efflux RND transporter periplasmic adaptor subunit, partial [Gemmataceae bacterium]|nr:efflux RND transporter periplasmic adaptor subunit [Gemmataceae bacterium]